MIIVLIIIAILVYIMSWYVLYQIDSYIDNDKIIYTNSQTLDYVIITVLYIAVPYLIIIKHVLIEVRENSGKHV
jgi:uncharacterized membrane protein YidH (DUF202 family)